MSLSRREQQLTRLVDADPAWVDTGPDNTVAPNRRGIGIQFACPIHDECLIYVPFQNPLDGGPRHTGGPSGWQRTGGAFADLTLAPSIRRLGGPDGCQWHGFVREGRFETCLDSE